MSLSSLSLSLSLHFQLLLFCTFKGLISGLDRSGPGSAPTNTFHCEAQKGPILPIQYFSPCEFTSPPLSTLFLYYLYFGYIWTQKKYERKLRIYDPNLVSDGLIPLIIRWGPPITWFHILSSLSPISTSNI